MLKLRFLRFFGKHESRVHSATNVSLTLQYWLYLVKRKYGTFLNNSKKSKVVKHVFSGTQTFKILSCVSLDDFMASSGARKHFSEIRNISLKIGYNRFKTVYICTISLFSTAFGRFSEMLKLRFLRFFAKHGSRVYRKLLSAFNMQIFHLPRNWLYLVKSKYGFKMAYNHLKP